MSNIDEKIIEQLNKERESAKRQERLGKMFGWKHFKNTKPFIFSINDCLALVDSRIVEADRSIHLSKKLLSRFK